MNGRLEHTVDRYLDRDLSPTETRAFEEFLESSEEARQLLAQSRAIRSAARSMSLMTTPDPGVESLLFQRLFGEGDLVGAVEDEEEPKRRAGILPFFQGLSGGVIGGAALGRAAMLVPAIVALLLFGSDLLRDDVVPVETSTVASIDLASTVPATVPSLATTPGSATEAGNDAANLDAGSLIVTTPIAESTPVARPVTNSSVSSVEVPTTPAPILPKTAEPNDVPPPFAQTDEDNPVDRITPNPAANPEDYRQEQADPSIDHDPALGRAIAADFARLDVDKKTGQSLAASYRHGLTRIVEIEDGAPAQDIALRIDGRIDDRHRISIAIGSSPHAVAETTYLLHAGVQDDKGGPTTASVETREQVVAEQEFWAGIGYGYALYNNNNLQIEAGVNLGLGNESNRIGIELPVRVAVTDRVNLEVVPHYTRTIARDTEIAVLSEQRPNTDLLQERQLLDGTSIGAQIGLSYSFGE